MSKTSVVTARIDDETLALLDSVAARQDRSRAWVVARAIESHARREAELLDFVEKGVNDLDAGRTISHDELINRIRARYASRES